jgi:hypothetical protein
MKGQGTVPGIEPQDGPFLDVAASVPASHVTTLVLGAHPPPSAPSRLVQAIALTWLSGHRLAQAAVQYTGQVSL